MVVLRRLCHSKNVAHGHCAEECLDFCAMGLMMLVDCSYNRVPHCLTIPGTIVFTIPDIQGLYATSQLSCKLDKMLTSIVDDTLILLIAYAIYCVTQLEMPV